MMRVLFIDRDGTLIVEPKGNYQVDSLEKLEFMPGVFHNLKMIRDLFDYRLVMVSNQDGLGTEDFPEEKFSLVQEKILTAFRNEGILFDGIHIDPSLPADPSPGRKPGTEMLKEYFSPDYDLGKSYVIGDRITDLQLALNLGARGILIGDEGRIAQLEPGIKENTVLAAKNWQTVFEFLRRTERQASCSRVTSETSVQVELSLDGQGVHEISTGVGFFDHMLEQLARHSGCDLFIRASGDLRVDEHHTIEDVGITLGEAFDRALGTRKGIERYGFVLPMDESLATTAIDLGGRSWLEWDVRFSREKIGDVPTEMFEHFFRSFASGARCSLHVRATGRNEHHKIEAVFKSFARTLKAAIRQETGNVNLPSTKGKI